MLLHEEACDVAGTSSDAARDSAHLLTLTRQKTVSSRWVLESRCRLRTSVATSRSLQRAAASAASSRASSCIRSSSSGPPVSDRQAVVRPERMGVNEVAWQAVLAATPRSRLHQRQHDRFAHSDGRRVCRIRQRHHDKLRTDERDPPRGTQRDPSLCISHSAFLAYSLTLHLS